MGGAGWRIVPLLFILLAGCAGPASLRPGEARMSDLRHTMGEPAAIWREPDGSTRLAYTNAPAGYETWMFAVDPSGTLKHSENVLDTRHFADIAPGMSQAQVTYLIGPPYAPWTTYFKARDELVWTWHYCDEWQEAEFFNVMFDAARGTVRSTQSVLERCGFDATCQCSHERKP